MKMSFDDNLQEILTRVAPKFNIPEVRKAVANRHIYLTSEGNLHNAFEFMIGLGPTRSFYTLWRINLNPMPFAKAEQYLQNLSQDAKEAILKAAELTGLDLSDDIFDIDEHGTKIQRQARVANVLHFGRYYGRRVEEVFQEDPGYITFMAQSDWQPSRSDIKANLAFITAVYGETAVEKQYLHDSSKAERDRERAVRDATRQPLPFVFGTRCKVMGTVLAIKTYDNEFGVSVKALIEGEGGWKLWGTKPCNCERGDKIEFMARIEKGKDGDPCFGYFSRPTKGQVL